MQNNNTNDQNTQGGLTFPTTLDFGQYIPQLVKSQGTGITDALTTTYKAVLKVTGTNYWVAPAVLGHLFAIAGIVGTALVMGTGNSTGIEGARRAG